MTHEGLALVLHTMAQFKRMSSVYLSRWTVCLRVSRSSMKTFPCETRAARGYTCGSLTVSVFPFSCVYAVWKESQLPPGFICTFFCRHMHVGFSFSIPFMLGKTDGGICSLGIHSAVHWFYSLDACWVLMLCQNTLPLWAPNAVKSRQHFLL